MTADPSAEREAIQDDVRGGRPADAGRCQRCRMWMYETLTAGVYRCLCCDDENNGPCPHRHSAPAGPADAGVLADRLEAVALECERRAAYEAESAKSDDPEGSCAGNHRGQIAAYTNAAKLIRAALASPPPAPRPIVNMSGADDEPVGEGWLVWGLLPDGSVSLLAVDLSQAVANRHRRAALATDAYVRVYIEPTRTNHLYGGSIAANRMLRDQRETR